MVRSRHIIHDDNAGCYYGWRLLLVTPQAISFDIDHSWPWPFLATMSSTILCYDYEAVSGTRGDTSNCSLAPVTLVPRWVHERFPATNPWVNNHRSQPTVRKSQGEPWMKTWCLLLLLIHTNKHICFINNTKQPILLLVLCRFMQH